MLQRYVEAINLQSHRDILEADQATTTPTGGDVLGGQTYYQAKQNASAEYRVAKHALRDADAAPFKEWIVSGAAYESFTAEH